MPTKGVSRVDGEIDQKEDHPAYFEFVVANSIYE
jgi:hypothetical protein